MAEIIWSTLLAPIKAVEIPFIETFGTGAWQIMRRRVELAVASRLEPRGTTYVNEGAARTFIKRLERSLLTLSSLKTPKNQNLVIEVTLIGHSMGAMLLNRILTLSQTLPIKRVIYMAAASRIDDFEQSALPYLNNENNNVDGWWFTLTRTDEANETLFKVTPKGTLLVWIDNYFELIGTLGQSTLGRMRNMKEYFQEWVSEPDNKGLRTVKDNHDSQFKPIRLRKADLGEHEPREHGDFDEPTEFKNILCRVDPAAFLEAAACRSY